MPGLTQMERAGNVSVSPVIPLSRAGDDSGADRPEGKYVKPVNTVHARGSLFDVPRVHRIQTFVYDFRFIGG